MSNYRLYKTRAQKYVLSFILDGWRVVGEIEFPNKCYQKSFRLHNDVLRISATASGIKLYKNGRLCKHEQ